MSSPEQNCPVAIASDADNENFRVTLWTIHRETSRYLDDLAQHVRECKRVDEASRFVRWLQFSGVLKLLEKYQNDQKFSSSLVVFNPSALRKKSDALLMDCGDLFRGGKANPRYAESDIAEINRKLDLLLPRSPSSLPVVEVSPPLLLERASALGGDGGGQ